MALHHQPKIVTDGLIFSYDMANGKSFIGGPVTNTLPTPDVNGLPTFGNGWATYNTNQYNNNTYFSIGSISSVASNIVTTSGNHPLRSYDVVTPQTTGGGVTAGVNYLVKKLSNTTFTLYSWNGSQDGSQGYINPATGNHKVYDDFSNDIRIAVNATNFPTMWWGPPHLANSALVKEIIPNGFTGIPGRPPTDCIRLHFNRTDATDGMAYGPDAAVTAGVLHTVSFWARSVSASAVGTTGSYQIYNYGATTPTGYSIGYTLGPVGVWQKYILQFTPNNPLAISYWFPGTGGIKYDISNIQFEVGSVANNFAPGTRTNTAAIRDLTNNNTITASSLTYANNGTFSFNGSSNTFNCGNSSALSALTGKSNVTVESWVNLSGYGSTSGYGVITHKGSPWAFLMENPSNTMRIRFGLSVSGDVACPDSATHALNTWYQFVGTYDGSNMRFYRNGVLTNTVAASGTLGGSGIDMIVGSYSGAYFSQGQIPIVKVYNRTLSNTEIAQNFNALRGRYGI
jgi:hypothetical protein